MSMFVHFLYKYYQAKRERERESTLRTVSSIKLSQIRISAQFVSTTTMSNAEQGKIKYIYSTKYT